MRSLTFVEIDIPYCDLVYGTAPCTAALGVTSDRKCFNTRRTCQDIGNFSPSPLTLRFTLASSDLDPFYEAIPSLLSVDITPAKIDPGVSMGERESVSITFADHPDSDAYIDKYLADRGYDSYARGTFWGKFRARVTSIKGQSVRVIRGERGQDIGDMVTRYYVGETTNGPRSERFVVIAKDPLKLLDGDRAQAPAISNGELAADIDGATTSATLSPSGIGNLEYPASGKLNLGGTEIVAFTRAGDALTIARGDSNTEPEEHAAGEIAQLVLEYSAESPADIIYDLLTTYTNMDASWLPLADWQEDIDQWIGRLYSAEIAEPTAVRKLIDELIEQVGLIFWWDAVGQMARLTALRPVTSSAPIYDLDRIMQGSYSAKDQPKKRVSQAWTYFNLINPLEKLDDTQNYRSAVASIDPNDTEPDYDDQPAISKVFSRWIDQFNRPAASRLNALKLARYQQAPREFAWSVDRSDTPPELGRGARVRHYSLQDDTGEQVTVPVQVTSVNPLDSRVIVTAEEMLFTDGDVPGDKAVIIDTDAFDINLRDLYDQFYAAPTMYDTVVFSVETGVKVGGFIGGQPSSPGEIGIAMDVGDWPPGVDIRINIMGGVHAKGGEGGEGQPANYHGGDGGTAIYTRVPVSIDNQGTIAGGGGGGGGAVNDNSAGGPLAPSAGGGGGAGFHGGFGGQNEIGATSSGTGDDGSVVAGGAGGVGAGADGGDGGDPGDPGENGTGGNLENGDGGDGGLAVDGISYVTWINEGTVQGATDN